MHGPLICSARANVNAMHQAIDLTLTVVRTSHTLDTHSCAAAALRMHRIGYLNGRRFGRQQYCAADRDITTVRCNQTMIFMKQIPNSFMYQLASTDWFYMIPINSYGVPNSISRAFANNGSRSLTIFVAAAATLDRVSAQTLPSARFTRIR